MFCSSLHICVDHHQLSETTKTPFDPFALWVPYVTKYVVSGQCSQGLLLVNRHFGTVRKIVLYNVIEQVDSQAIGHFVWSSASSTFLFFGDISNDYSRPEKKKFVGPFNQFQVKNSLLFRSENLPSGQ